MQSLSFFHLLLVRPRPIPASNLTFLCPASLVSSPTTEFHEATGAAVEPCAVHSRPRIQTKQIQTYEARQAEWKAWVNTVARTSEDATPLLTKEWLRRPTG
ncbi:uncharacterized protein SPSK_06772 [Sporothrix schenckii 1099-18]|uniref:Uncharacterized protein n=1 Tax=Sporothrix schenckii 1099-18 TaxID=1397361 RepID=A0A0F2MI71_SPOSC|nr:uncharacterized protein SPSK_06772 [Sporothrix schenckii 1099-18]KJR89398.1 hypothetical protein SPSK_06772 [Sporothrix schenckii 1099-18]